MGREEAKGLNRRSVLFAIAVALTFLLTVSLANGAIGRVCDAIGSNHSLIRRMTAFLMMLA